MSEKKQLKIIATKVPEDSYNLLKSLCDRNGINAYTLIQWMANVFVRFSDDMHNLDDRLCKAIRLFEDPSVWGDSFNIFRNSDTIVEGAVYITKSKDSSNAGSVFVGRDFFGKRECTYNSRDILEMIFENTFPTMYRKVRAAGVELGTTSVIETVSELIDRYSDGSDIDDIRQMFEDNRRHENNRKSGNDTSDNATAYVTHQRKSI